MRRVVSRKLSSGLYCVRELGSSLFIYIEREREREIMRHQFFICNLKRVKCNKVRVRWFSTDSYASSYHSHFSLIFQCVKIECQQVRKVTNLTSGCFFAALFSLSNHDNFTSTHFRACLFGFWGIPFPTYFGGIACQILEKEERFLPSHGRLGIIHIPNWKSNKWLEK